MTRNPDRMMAEIMRVRTPLEMLGVDLDDPDVWDRPDLPEEFSITVHHGGGKNPAGDPIEEPGMSLRQKIAVQLGRISPILKCWLGWHTRIVNGIQVMSTIAYCRWIDGLFGRTGRLRSHRYNGAQWGSQNRVTDSIVFVLGLGQKVWRRGWLTLGLWWFCAGAPEVKGHCDWNDHPETRRPTSCPGPERHRLLHTDPPEYIRALGKLRWPRRFPLLRSRGVRVRAVTYRLTELDRLDGMVNQYRRPVKLAVVGFQRDHGLRPDGIVGPETWKALAAA